MNFSLTTLPIAILSMISPSVLADEWPQFRGPAAQGIANVRNVPLEWSGEKNVAWKQPIPGLGWSSPILSGGRLYLTSAVSEDGPLSLRALCLDARDGKILWNVEVFQPGAQSPRPHNKNSHASPTPIVEENRLYVHFGHQGTACLDLDGKVIWRNTSLNYQPVHGNGGSPAISGNSLVFSCDGGSDPFVAALNKNTGALLWKAERKVAASKTFSFSTPLLINVNGKPQIISPGSNVICAYDPATGREIWRVTYEGYSVVPRPVFGHGLLFMSTGFDRPVVMAIRPDGQGDVTASHVAWTLKRGGPNTPSLLLVGQELYMVSDAGIASCVDALTGQVHWQERIGGNYSASPLFAAGRIYFHSEDGTTTVLKPGREFVKLASNPLGEKMLASSAVTDGALFLRTEKHLFKIATSGTSGTAQF